MDNELITIPAIVYQNAMNGKDKIIKGLIVTLVIVCMAFVGYIAVDRYLDATSVADNSVEVAQDTQDNGYNIYNNGGNING